MLFIHVCVNTYVPLLLRKSERVPVVCWQKSGHASSVTGKSSAIIVTAKREQDEICSGQTARTGQGGKEISCSTLSIEDAKRLEFCITMLVFCSSWERPHKAAINSLLLKHFKFWRKSPSSSVWLNIAPTLQMFCSCGHQHRDPSYPTRAPTCCTFSQIQPSCFIMFGVHAESNNSAPLKNV